MIRYTTQFREKVFSVKNKYNLTFEETSERFDISIRSLFRWQRQLELRIKRNKPATKIDMETLQNHVNEFPDAYLHERAELFNVTPSAIYYALIRLGISYKKNTTAFKTK